jgi:signal transduction histidine kinase
MATLEDLPRIVGAAVHQVRGQAHTLGLVLHLLERNALRGQPIEPALLRRGRSALRRLARVLDEIVDVTRAQSGELTLYREPFDLAALVREAALEVDGRRAGDLHLDLPDGPVPVCADRACLMRVIGHLLDNATRHTPPGTLVLVTLSAQPDQVELVIEDRGPGLPAWRAQSEEVDPHDRGLGAGLPICESLVAQHGGTLTLAPGPDGRGVRAEIRLPRD